MSSRKRRQKIGNEKDFFSEPLDLQSADSLLYGEIAAADFQTIENVNIFEIMPGSSQPRRAIPFSIRQYWNEQGDRIDYLFENWLKEIENERGAPFDLDAYLQGDDTRRGKLAESIKEDEIIPLQKKVSVGPLEDGFLKIVDLAASIRRDGLTNPITATRYDEHFVIETGERRWLAFHLLHNHFGAHDIGLDGMPRDWSLMPVKIVQNIDVWRQASENNARDNLNAISKARQLALLLMDIYTKRGSHFKSFDLFDNQQGFYAQVADGHEWRIPRGEGERLINAVGLKHADQLRQYRRLLRLPEVVWELADDLNWTIGFIQKQLVDKANNDEAFLEQLAIREAKKQGLYRENSHDIESNAEIEAFVPERPIHLQGRPLAHREDRQRFKFLQTITGNARNADGETKDAIRKAIRQQRAWLKGVEEMLQS